MGQGEDDEEEDIYFDAKLKYKYFGMQGFLLVQFHSAQRFVPMHSEPYSNVYGNQTTCQRHTGC